MKRWMIAMGCIIAALAVGIGLALAGKGKTADMEETEPERVSAVEIRETDKETVMDAAENGSVPNPEEENMEGREKSAKPSKEEVLAMRAAVLEGMSEEAVNRLTENIKVANIWMEQAYFYDDFFGRLADPESLYWNYVDEKGEIQIGWAFEDGVRYDGTDEAGRREFEEKYGAEVKAYNRLDGDDFIALMEEMRDSLESGLLKGDFDSLIENMRLAKETHDVLYMENIYHILHDMDYFLLRYGPEDVGKYTKDGGTVNKYYGVLDVYHSWAEPADETGPDQDKPGTVRVANPSWDYYIEASGETETAPLELVVLEQTKNEITDEEQWFAKNGLVLPDLNEEGYECFVHDDRVMIDIIKNGETEVTLDFSDYRYADDFRPEEMAFIGQEIHGAAVREGILYLSTFHYTYAESSPHTAYMTAVSLDDYRVLWKTEPLTCNSLNFEIVGDVILCGYGFTAEDDYLYQIDSKTGRRIGQTPLASMANYIVYKDGKLFVRTYHTDYVFQIGEE